MKLVIDLEDVWADGDTVVAEIIRDEISRGIRRFYAQLIRDTMKEHEKQARALVQRAAKRDWKKVAEVLASLQEVAE